MNAPNLMRPQTEPEPLLLTFSQGAKLLGVSRETFRKVRQAGGVKVVTLPGGVQRVRRADLEAMIDRAAVAQGA